MEARQGHKRDLLGGQAHSERRSTPCPQGCRQGSHDNIHPKSSEIFCLTNHMSRENFDVVGDKPVRNDAGEMSLSEKT